MARKTAKQKDLTAQVHQRQTGADWVRVDASSIKGGKNQKGIANVVRTNEIHPSLESGTESMSEKGLQGGTITTPDGLSVRVSRMKGGDSYSPQSREMGNPNAPALQEGVSARFERRVQRDTGPEVAARLNAEAEEIARRPNPLRSDGHVDALMALHSPSVGGNRRQPGAMSALARMDEQFKPSSRAKDVPDWGDVSDGPVDKPLQGARNLMEAGPVFHGGRDIALHTLGYGEDVQKALLEGARDRIARRSQSDPRNQLSDLQIKSRAYEQVNERLDEVLHGTKDIGPGGTSPIDMGKPSGLGMTPKRTPEQEAQRKVGRELITSGSRRDKSAAPDKAGRVPHMAGPWAANLNKPAGEITREETHPVRNEHGEVVRDEDTGEPETKKVKVSRPVTAVDRARTNNIDLLTKQQEARRRSLPAPNSTLEEGANVPALHRTHTQPPFSTNNPGVSLPQSYGRPSAKLGKDQSKITMETAPVLPARPREGAISPVPPNLPTGPGKIGRTREERGIKPSSFPTGKEPVVAAKPGSFKPPAKKSKTSLPPSNVDVAQTAVPVQREKTKNFAEIRAEQRARL